MSVQGTPDSKVEADANNLSAAVDQNGKPLPESVDPAKDTCKDSDKDSGKKVELSADSKKDKYGYKPKGILQSKYHVQVQQHIAYT